MGSPYHIGTLALLAATLRSKVKIGLISGLSAWFDSIPDFAMVDVRESVSKTRLFHYSSAIIGTIMSPRPKKGPARTAFAMVDPAWLALPLTLTELKVLIALSLHADWSRTGNGRCYPKRETIARECRVQVSHVSEALPKLEQLGLVHVARLGRKNVYFVRPIGATYVMPPSNAEPFFAYLAENGHEFQVDLDGALVQTAGDLRSIHPIYTTIASEYELNLTEERLRAAVASRLTKTAA